MTTPFRALIFDFDGVLADSEALANAILTQQLISIGIDTSVDQVMARYMGKRWPDAMALVEESLGRPLPADFTEQTQDATLAGFREALREVKGASRFIQRFVHLPRAIASSSSIKRLTLCVELLNMEQHFAGRVLSADMVERGKPHPDIFLHAAALLDTAPESCLIIEDSPSGVKAGKAAGMTVAGLCAGSHIQPDHATRLTDAGADMIAYGWDELADMIADRVTSAT